MDREVAEEFIRNIYKGILKRSPGESEFNHWVTQACTLLRPEQILKAFLSGQEYSGKFEIESRFPNGHFYSPVVDPRLVRDYVHKHRSDELHGIILHPTEMLDFWNQNLEFIRETPFGEVEEPNNRYYYANGNYPHGDAIILRAMIGHYKPSRVVEIGSGFSSACMLDASDHAGLDRMRLTCIEPDTERLKRILRKTDYARVEIIESIVQEIGLDVFKQLGRGDILFIDSTHVLKTGSDVHYELFSILPILKPGVIVHFHDIHYPFEYPDDWIFTKNHSWNEIYALRSFLMYNKNFKIKFWNGFMAYRFREKISATFPLFLTNPGGSIWIEAMGTTS